MTEPQAPGDILRAPLIIEYPFKRTTGPVIGAFLTGLREQVLVGPKALDGRVIVPPAEFDPIVPDGADTPMLGAVKAAGPDAVAAGTKVRPVWADEREGRIEDIAHWEVVA